METNQEFTEDDLLYRDKSELDKIKVIQDILNSPKKGNNIEQFIKSKLAPLMPVITGFIAVTLFINGINDKSANEFKEAQNRYNAELDLVRLVWDDVRDTINKKNAKKAADYIIRINSLNNSFNIKDNAILKIEDSLRPLKLFISSNPVAANKAVSQEVSNNSDAAKELQNKTIKNLQKVNDTIKLQASVTAIKSTAITNAVEKIAKNQLTVYIQYSNKEDKATIDNLAEKLKSFYVVPGIDYVENKSYFQNEIRYYSDADLEKATDVAKKLRQLYNKDFQLRNIQQSKIKNTIEVWIDNTNSKTQPPVDVPKVNTVGEYTVETYERFAAKRYFNYINDDISVHVLGYNPEKRFVTMKINDRNQFDVNVGETSPNVGFGDYQIYIKVNKYGKNSSFQVRNAAYYTITIKKKK